MAAEHHPAHDPSRLLSELDLHTPLIGLYDAPDPEAFAPLVAPPKGAAVAARACSTTTSAGRRATPCT